MINQLSKIRVMGLRLCAGFEEAAVCYEKAFGEGLWLGSDCCPLLTASKKTGISVHRLQDDKFCQQPVDVRKALISL